jgi:hypothetical protein
MVWRNSGWPMRKLCSSACFSSWKFDSMRSSSTARGVRFCASSTIISARLPFSVSPTRKASIDSRMSDLSRFTAGRPSAAATIRSMSSASSRVLTICAATTRCGSSLSSRLRTRVVLPAPISPVMTMKPSLWCRPYSR